MGWLANTFVTVVVLNGLAAADVMNGAEEAHNAGEDVAKHSFDHTFYKKALTGLRAEFPDAAPTIGMASLIVLRPGLWVAATYIEDKYQPK